MQYRCHAALLRLRAALTDPHEVSLTTPTLVMLLKPTPAYLDVLFGQLVFAQQPAILVLANEERLVLASGKSCPCANAQGSHLRSSPGTARVNSRQQRPAVAATAAAIKAIPASARKAALPLNKHEQSSLPWRVEGAASARTLCCVQGAPVSKLCWNRNSSASLPQPLLPPPTYTQLADDHAVHKNN